MRLACEWTFAVQIFFFWNLSVEFSRPHSTIAHRAVHRLREQVAFHGRDGQGKGIGVRFICMGFLNEAAWAQLSPAEQEARIDACIRYDEELKQAGHFAGGEALQHPRQAVTLRAGQAGPVITDGPHIETKEILGGILLLEARDLNHAIALMSQHPGVQMGAFEIRPADTGFQEWVEQRKQSLQ